LDARIAEWEQRGSFERKLLGENFKLVPPRVHFTDELDLELGNLHFRVLRLGGHTAEQSVVWIPALRTLIASDNLFNGKPAFVGEGDRWQWIRALEVMQQLGAELVVPGHGAVGNANLLDAQVAELRAGISQL
jgi:cyclase